MDRLSVDERIAEDPCGGDPLRDQELLLVLEQLRVDFVVRERQFYVYERFVAAGCLARRADCASSRRPAHGPLRIADVDLVRQAQERGWGVKQRTPARSVAIDIQVGCRAGSWVEHDSEEGH